MIEGNLTWQVTGHLTGPTTATKGGKQTEVVQDTREKHLRKEETLKGQVSQQELRRSPGFWLPAHQGPDAHSRLLLGKGKWLKSSFQDPHCPGQLGPPLPSPRKRGYHTGPLAGSRVEIKINALGIVELTTWRVQLPAINTIREVAFSHPGL